MAQLEGDKDRRASRAWRLSPAATAHADADQHREHRAWRAKNWVPAPDSAEPSEPDAFFNLFCSTCHYFLSENGVMMQMLAKPSSICFSTDERPQNISLQDEAAKMPGMCDCKVHDFACGCGTRLGYHLLSPCDYCEKEGTKQRWFLCPSCVEAEPREAPPRTPRTPRWSEPQEKLTTQKRDSPQFGQARKDEGSAKPSVLSDLNGREKMERKEGQKELKEPEKSKDGGNIWDVFGAEAGQSCSMSSELAQRLADVERRERAVSAREEDLKQREHQLWLETSKPMDIRTGTVGTGRQEKDVPSSGQVESFPVQGIQGIPTPSKPDLSDPQGRLEYSQRLIEKRKDLERWQQTLEDRKKELDEREKSLPNGKPVAGTFSVLAHVQADDVVNAASVAGKAMVGAGFAASKVLVAVARPVFGAMKLAGSAAIHFGVSSYTTAMAYANEEAQEQALAQATALRQSKYYAMASPMQSMGPMGPIGSMGMAPPDGSGVPPRPRPGQFQSPQVWSRGSWSPGWGVSPIYPSTASPVPHLAPVMEREGLVAWMRRNSGCGTRNQGPAYPPRYPTR